MTTLMKYQTLRKRRHVAARTLSISCLLFACSAHSNGGTATMTPDMQPGSDHFDGKVFFDPRKAWEKSFLDVLKWQFAGGKEQWPSSVANELKPAPAPRFTEQAAVNIFFINHATFLIQAQGINILTDPLFSERASPFSWAGPRRSRPPAMALNDLPPIDVILISHNHYDHMDEAALKKLAERFDPIFIMPLANARHLPGLDPAKVKELDWWQSHSPAAGMEVSLTPVQHWSARGLGDRNESLWGGFLIRFSQGPAIFFAGDTGYTSWFKDIRQRHQAIEIALLPIGAYEPRWFMRDQHMNPEEAVQAHLDLGAAFSLGMHFETIQLTDEGFERPRQALTAAIAKLSAEGAFKGEFVAPLHGESFTFRKTGQGLQRLDSTSPE